MYPLVLYASGGIRTHVWRDSNPWPPYEILQSTRKSCRRMSDSNGVFSAPIRTAAPAQNAKEWNHVPRAIDTCHITTSVLHSTLAIILPLNCVGWHLPDPGCTSPVRLSGTDLWSHYSRASHTCQDSATIVTPKRTYPPMVAIGAHQVRAVFVRWIGQQPFEWIWALCGPFKRIERPKY